MSKKIDLGFGGRFKQAAENARVLEMWQGSPGSPTAIAAYIGGSVKKQHVDKWMKGTLPRADQLWDIAEKFKVDGRWLATGKITDTSGTVHKDKRTIPSAKSAYKILAVLVALLDTDDEGVEESLAAVEAVIGEHGISGRQRGRTRRAR